MCNLRYCAWNVETLLCMCNLRYCAWNDETIRDIRDILRLKQSVSISELNVSLEFNTNINLFADIRHQNSIKSAYIKQDDDMEFRKQYKQ